MGRSLLFHLGFSWHLIVVTEWQNMSGHGSRGLISKVLYWLLKNPGEQKAILAWQPCQEKLRDPLRPDREESKWWGEGNWFLCWSCVVPVGSLNSFTVLVSKTTGISVWASGSIAVCVLWKDIEICVWFASVCWVEERTSPAAWSNLKLQTKEKLLSRTD